MLAACQLVPVPTRNRRLPRSRSAAASTPVVSASMPRSCSGWDCIVSLMKLTATLPSMVHGSIARYWMRGCQPASRVRRDRAARRRLRGAEREHDRVRAAAIVAPASSQPPQPPAAGVRLVTVATGLDSPVDVAGIPGTAKLAVVEKTGRVLVVTDGHPAPKPLLDLRGQVSQGSEQGLLSIVFSPRYANERSRLRRLHRPGREYPRRRAGHPQRQPADDPVRAPAVLEPQRRGAGVRPRRHAVRGHGRRRQRGRPRGQRPEPGVAARQDPAAGRRASPTRAHRCTHTGCATRGGSRSTRPPATSGSATSGRTATRRSTTWPPERRPARTWAGTPTRAERSTSPSRSTARGWCGRSPSTRTARAARSPAATSTAAGDVPALRGRYVYGDFCSGRIWSLPATRRQPAAAGAAQAGGAVLVRPGRTR